MVNLGDYSQAIDLAEKYIGENPYNLGLLCVLQNGYHKSGIVTLAEHYEEQILDLDPNYKCKLITLLASEDEPFVD